MLIKTLMLAAFFALTIFVGFYFRKRAENINDFVLGGRQVGMWITAFSYGAAYFSAVVFVGFAGQFGWRFGIAAVWIGLGNAFLGSLAPWFVLGRRTRVMTNHLKSATMPEFFGARYASPALKIAAAITAFIWLIPYTASLYNGLSRLFEQAFGGDFVVWIIAMAVLTAVYVVAGGYTASSVNSFIQGILMIVGMVILIGTVMASKGGLMKATAELAHVNAESGPGAGVPGVFASFFGPDPVSLLGVILLTSLGTWGLPQMVARFYSIKNENMITKGAIVSTVFAIIIAGGSYFLGGFGRIFVTGQPAAFDAIIPAIVAGLKSDAVIGLVILLVLGASISTLSSLVMASASTLTLDFLKGSIIKNMSEKTQLLIIRIMIVAFISISSLIAIDNYNTVKAGGAATFIAQLMGISWGALAGAFLAPFLYGLYWKRVSKLSVWCCFIFSSGLMALNVILSRFFPAAFTAVFHPLLRSPINAGAFAMLAGLIIVPAVSALAKAPDKNHVDKCFACYEQTVNVKLRDDLGG